MCPRSAARLSGFVALKVLSQTCDDAGGPVRASKLERVALPPDSLVESAQLGQCHGHRLRERERSLRLQQSLDQPQCATPIANTIVGAGVEVDSVAPAELARLVEARERIPRAAFDEAIAKVGDPGFTADLYLAQEAVSDTAELGPVVDAILAANPGQVEAYRGGKEGLLGFFVGQVMKETQGKANARVVSELVRSKLQA